MHENWETHPNTVLPFRYLNGTSRIPLSSLIDCISILVAVVLSPIRKVLAGNQTLWLRLVLDPHTAGTASVVLYRTCLD